jgi:dihydrolipoamide dehydrogenase
MTGELLGPHSIGAKATELIAGLSIGRSLETTAEDMTATIFPHPALSEMLHEAFLAALGRAIHY